MRCESCNKMTREYLDGGRDYTCYCTAAKKGHRKLATIRYSFCTYSSKVIYAPKWCPKKEAHS